MRLNSAFKLDVCLQPPNSRRLRLGVKYPAWGYVTWLQLPTTFFSFPQQHKCFFSQPASHPAWTAFLLFNRVGRWGGGWIFGFVRGTPASKTRHLLSIKRRVLIMWLPSTLPPISITKRESGLNSQLVLSLAWTGSYQLLWSVLLHTPLPITQRARATTAKNYQWSKRLDFHSFTSGESNNQGVCNACIEDGL